MKKSFLPILVLSTLFMIHASPSRGAENNVPWKNFTGDRRVDSILSTMTVREMIAQLIWIPAWADAKGATTCRLKNWLRNTA